MSLARRKQIMLRKMAMNTYNAPEVNRKRIMEMKFVAKADRKENINAPIAAVCKTLCRPHVSAKNPQKCDVNTIPKYEMALSRPCSSVVNFRSHFTYGIIKLILRFSIAVPNTHIAVKRVKIF